MGKVRRGNYIFVTWVGDHPPRHVHIYKDGKLVVKWDLKNRVAMVLLYILDCEVDLVVKKKRSRLREAV